jgi:hypothetical protein
VANVTLWQLYTGGLPLELTEEEPEWVPQQVWTFWKREKFLPLPGFESGYLNK